MRTENEERSTARPAETFGATNNPHVLWRQLVGLVLWVGIVAFLAGGPLASMLALLLGGLTFADAWMSGIYKLPDKRSLSNNSPMAWGIAMAFLLVVGYPLYLIHRNKFRTVAGPGLFYWAVVVVGGLVLALCTLGTVRYFAM